MEGGGAFPKSTSATEIILLTCCSRFFSALILRGEENMKQNMNELCAFYQTFRSWGSPVRLRGRGCQENIYVVFHTYRLIATAPTCIRWSLPGVLLCVFRSPGDLGNLACFCPLSPGVRGRFGCCCVCVASLACSVHRSRHCLSCAFDLRLCRSGPSLEHRRRKQPPSCQQWGQPPVCMRPERMR